MRRISFYAMAILFSTISCTVLRPGIKDDGKIEAIFVQVNDVYEIAPLAGGREGGMARVATLKKQLQQKNPNTFLIMAGDFVSPSVYNSLQYEGKRIRGRQMIETMNTAGTDMVTFGNHEFDINENELQERINESNFLWIASNTFHKKNNGSMPFSKKVYPGNPFPRTWVQKIRDNDGTTAAVGFIGLTLPFNNAEYVTYTDPITTAKELYNQLKDSVDAVVAITHLEIEMDRQLAREIPGLKMIIGGHEHDMRIDTVNGVYITKAHANAKSAYVIHLELNKKRGTATATQKLVYVNEQIAFDSATQAVVEKWQDIAEKNFSTLGFDARKVLLTNSEPLDGRETEVRSRTTNLTKLIVEAMASAAPQAQVILLNAGSIRVDDILPMPVTQYDLIRSLPFGGSIKEVDMKGSLLVKTLGQGRKNKGIGGFLHFNNAVAYDATAVEWKLNGKAIDTSKVYRVALSDFLLTGREANLDFLNTNNPDIVNMYNTDTKEPSALSDIRLAVVQYLEKKL